MLQIEHHFLRLNFISSFFFCWQIQFVFACKQLFISLKDRISGNVFVCIRTKNDPDRRIVAFCPFQFIVHPDIHVHLSYVLMGNLACFQIDQNKTFQDVIVEHEINVVILFFRMNMLLSGNERISFSKLHQKLLQIRDDTFFQIGF